MLRFFKPVNRKERREDHEGELAQHKEQHPVLKEDTAKVVQKSAEALRSQRRRDEKKEAEAKVAKTARAMKGWAFIYALLMGSVGVRNDPKWIEPLEKFEITRPAPSGGRKKQARAETKEKRKRQAHKWRGQRLGADSESEEEKRFCKAGVPKEGGRTARAPFNETEIAMIIGAAARLPATRNPWRRRGGARARARAAPVPVPFEFDFQNSREPRPLGRRSRRRSI